MASNIPESRSRASRIQALQDGRANGEVLSLQSQTCLVQSQFCHILCYLVKVILLFCASVSSYGKWRSYLYLPHSGVIRIKCMNICREFRVVPGTSYDYC